MAAQRPPPVTVVIARYRESTKWLQALLASKPNWKVVVYAKGGPSTEQLPKSWEVRPLPNVGMCDHTYLHHIARCYDQLSPLTLFLPASGNCHRKLWVVKHIIANAQSGRAATPPTARMPLRAAWPIQLTHYICANQENRAGFGNRLQPLALSPVRPFGPWVSSLGIEWSGRVFYSGVFSATKEQITGRPRHLYAKLEAQVSRTAYMEASHFVERLWHTLLNKGEASGEASAEATAQTRAPTAIRPRLPLSTTKRRAPYFERPSKTNGATAPPPPES
jgi:Protein of unknown function (DUF3431)